MAHLFQLSIGRLHLLMLRIFIIVESIMAFYAPRSKSGMAVNLTFVNSVSLVPGCVSNGLGPVELSWISILSLVFSLVTLLLILTFVTLMCTQGSSRLATMQSLMNVGSINHGDPLLHNSCTNLEMQWSMISRTHLQLNLPPYHHHQQSRLLSRIRRHPHPFMASYQLLPIRLLSRTMMLCQSQLLHHRRHHVLCHP